VNDTRAAVVGIGLALDEAFILQAVDRDTDGTAGEPDLLAERIHRQRAFVEQNLEHAKIREAKAERMNVPESVRLESVESLPEHQP
jgi:hypothetical protein